MKKVQLPVLGGFRKVIFTGQNTAVGTTIAEVGSGTISLTQLAAAINNILQGSSTVTTGSSSAGNLVVGPGLAGGGTLVGNVPLRLTAPIPWFEAEQGDDGERGPPGPAGAVGATGPQGPQGPAGSGTGGSGGLGTLMMFIPDDHSFDDVMPIPGPAGPTGAPGATGTTGAKGASTLMVMIPEDGQDADFLLIPGPAGATGTTGPQGPAGSGGSGGGATGAHLLFDTNYDDDFFVPNQQVVNFGSISQLYANSFHMVNPNTLASTAYIATNGSGFLGSNTAGNQTLSWITGGTVTIGTPQGADSLDIYGQNFQTTLHMFSANQAAQVADVVLERPGSSTANLVAAGAGIQFGDPQTPRWGLLQQAGAQNELWQYNASGWVQEWYTTTNCGMVKNIPVRGVSLTVSGAVHANVLMVDASQNTVSTGDLVVQRASSTANTQAFGPNLQLYDATVGSASMLQQSGGQTELWQSNGTTWSQIWYVNTGSGMVINTATSGSSLLVNGGIDALAVIGSDGTEVFKVDSPTKSQGLFFSFRNGGTEYGFFGNGPETFAGAALADFTIGADTGNLNLNVGAANALKIAPSKAATFTSSVSIAGATPPVTAGQTALGITTTATVITTAGGIALPALASTFWVVNVNGVKYGVPCFAL